MNMNIEEATSKVIRRAVGVDEGFKQELYGTRPHVRTVTILTGNNPYANPCPAWLNNENNAQLESLLKRGGFVYRKAIGKYGSLEHSLVIVDLDFDYARDLAAQFRQESFIFGERDDEASANDRRTRLTYRMWCVDPAYTDGLRKAWAAANDRKLHFETYERKGDDGEAKTYVSIPDNVQPFSDGIVYPKLDKSRYVSDPTLDATDQTVYHNVKDVEVGDDGTEVRDDYYTRKGGFKFSFPFPRFNESVDQVVESVEDGYATARENLGEKAFKDAFAGRCAFGMSAIASRFKIIRGMNGKNR